MATPIPTLGYPTRTAAVLALRAQGLTTRQIASRIGIPAATVTALEATAVRRRSKRHPDGPAGRGVLFPPAILDALGPAAARRNMHPNNLARLIVETVVREKMIDAVLDDADDLQGAA